MILGHRRQIVYLERVWKNKRLAHAYLFYGPEHMGKLALAKEFAKMLDCTAGADTIGSACGACDSCKKIERGAHLDVILLDVLHPLIPPKNEEKRTKISIHDIHELKGRFSLAPRADQWRIAIIGDAELLSNDAANAFLKLLEEPGRQTLFLLITAHPELLLPTIRSRAQMIVFSLVPNTVLDQWLQERAPNPKERSELVALAAGRPGMAMTLLADNAARREAGAWHEAVRHLIERGSGADALVLAERAAGDPARHASLIGAIWSELSHLLRAADSVHRSALVQSAKKIDILATALATTNANPRLLFDVILLELVQRWAKS